MDALLYAVLVSTWVAGAWGITHLDGRGLRKHPRRRALIRPLVRLLVVFAAGLIVISAAAAGGPVAGGSIGFACLLAMLAGRMSHFNSPNPNAELGVRSPREERALQGSGGNKGPDG